MPVSDPDRLVRRIAALQSDGSPCDGPGPWPAGLFPTWRFHATLPYQRPDTNIFNTALTVFTLNGFREKLSLESQALVDEITRRAQLAYPAYRNRHGGPTYNNYETRPGGQFQTGHLFHRFDHFRLPDDIDDTALIYLTKPHLREEVLAVKTRLPHYANGAKRWIKNTLPDYRKLRAYSTWFGKNMAIDFDVCALCNLFLLIFRENLPLNESDLASLELIQRVVLSGDYRRRPFDVSHHYPRPALIFYHVARLLAAHDPPPLAGCRERLMTDGPQILQEKLEFFDRVLVSTSLRRLGGDAPKLNEPVDFEEEIENYAFFVGCMLTPFERPALLYRWAHHPFTHFRWRCPAHSLAVWGESLV